MWPPRRIVLESLLSVVLATLVAGTEALRDGGAVRIVAVALAAGLLLPLRRVLPGTVLLVAVAASFPFGGFALLVPVASWSGGRRIDGVGRATATFALAYVLDFGLDLSQELPRVSPAVLVIVAMVTLVATIVPGLAGRYWSQRRTLLDTLREYNAQLLRERAMIAGQARMRERQRIAQDMHDSLGHQLALISVHTGALEVDRELTGRQREAVGVLREASVGAMHELREVVGLLRDGTPVPGDGATPPAVASGAPTPPALEAMGEEDAKAPSRGVAGIERLVEASRSAGTAVELRRSGEVRPLAPTAGHAAYRIAQEGLTNAHKHAPGASITIELRYEPDSLVVEVANGPVPETADDGRSVVSGGQGLTGLRERARLVGGMVHVGSTADGGFRLAGVLPYTAPEPGATSSSPGDETATFVDPTGDFRQQLATGSLGEADPVIDGNGSPKELARAMSTQKRSSGTAIGCGVAALLAVLLVAGLLVGAAFLTTELNKAMIDPKEYAAVTVGRSETAVRKQLPDGSAIMTDGLDKGAPPVPEGAKCLSLNSSELGSSWEKEPVFRFCFKDGKLIEKKSFEVTS
ncbi:sensor histidine kinase [Streptomyces sioyaensis]|uniref:histidine kinase n=1 Tax=Streptomyces sioyaensis TaxID=67364 RepID=A0A4V1NQV9_9ACTN|nr:histidine kinase [Streptomyces sioyaensis]MBM4793004.1 sensor histidine kinase [Streptomyces sioyaensis]RXS69679.1 sensor histidine kinase [Streptomyces sioyaensis]